MLRSTTIALLLALGACSGKYKLDRDKVDALQNQAIACKDPACAGAALDEIANILAESGNSPNGTAPEDTQYILDAMKVVRAKIDKLKKP
jgi:hypothetical protein